jgi:hypothetical protein
MQISWDNFAQENIMMMVSIRMISTNLKSSEHLQAQRMKDVKDTFSIHVVRESKVILAHAKSSGDLITRSFQTITGRINRSSLADFGQIATLASGSPLERFRGLQAILPLPAARSFGTGQP